jgi:hypothetical protein
MRLRRAIILLALCWPAPAAKFTLTDAAAITTITVNVLDIKQTVTKARKVAKRVKAIAKKAAQKVAGK